MRPSLALGTALSATLLAIAGAQAQTATPRSSSGQPSMRAPTSPAPAPVVRDRPGGEIAVAKPPPTPAPVTTDPAGSTLRPLPCRDGPFRATIDGRPATITGRLCEQPDGTWAPR